MRVSRGLERAGTLGDQPRPAAPAVVGLEPLARHRPVRLQPDQHLQATVRCVQGGQRAPGGQTRGRQRAGAARARSGSAGGGPPCCSRHTAAPSRSCSWCGAPRRSRGTAASPRGSHPHLAATRSPSGRRSWTGSSGCRAAQSVFRRRTADIEVPPGQGPVVPLHAAPAASLRQAVAGGEPLALYHVFGFSCS